ncbi:4-phosphoerythronate dehydrogenase [Mariprofundus aestuarium]|uniref:4-phosphoerythronate dehydrogenase n=1 Tax=Mariprofundus aestuarium TaxID=1921086 RepID=A0A2K8KZF8_MARES|nr:4-phosphoerythronate dehydrogenase [Mariprofundus aestuarium]ATX80377.1 4-phosphoerythronate dehydrogenase [Mariprofundus aestuarium]
MSRNLTIVADAHIWGVESAFSRLKGLNTRLRILENRDINREMLMDTDILLTRSSTKVNAELLQGTPVRFAATATIGDDHYDKAWLDANGIAWANAAGSSTGSVIEYMIASLLQLHANGVISIPDTAIGIIGVGRIGSALAQVCKAVGIKVLLNDPPRQRREGSGAFVSLDEVLEQADIITLHTPMIRDKEDCTHHLINEERLSRFQGRGIFNAARGGCLDNLALIDWLEDDRSRFAALDCWENEPAPLQKLLQHPQMVIATPHVAGHSLDGKAANTQYVYNALCQFLGIEQEWNMQQHLPAPPAPIIIEDSGDPWITIYAAARQLYPIDKDHATMKSWGGICENELPTAFASYRRHYPARRAWMHSPVHFNSKVASVTQLAHAFGIKVI